MNCNQLSELLQSNSYPGRSIVIGRHADGVHTVIAYFAEHLPDVGVRAPEGTYILWFDFTARCRALGIDGAELHRRIFEDARVLLQDGTNFDPQGGEFFQRMVVPSPRCMLLDACERIAHVMGK